jgi:hypothetical protein
MDAGARTFTLEDTFLELQVLDPPPTRHALFIFLLALAAALHLATAGWSDLYDGRRAWRALSGSLFLQRRARIIGQKPTP